MSSDDVNPDELSESSRESVKKVRSLVDDLKSVEEHEKSVLEERNTMAAKPSNRA